MSSSHHRYRRLAPALLAVLALAPLVASNYDLFRLEIILLYAAAALGMHLTMQVSGEFMVGHVAIVGMAAYAVAWINANHGWSSLASLPVALIAGGLAAALLGLPGLRLSSFYLGIISFFAVLLLPDLAIAFRSVSGGEVGLTVDKMSFFGTRSSDWVVYEVALLVLLVSFVFVRNLVRSTYGTRFMALRDSPEALQAAGISVNTTKSLVYVLSSVPASLAGWMLAQVNGVVIAGFFGLALTLLLVAAVIMGGRRTVIGVVVAACLLAGYTNLVGQFSEYNQLGLGLILIVVLVIAPSGADSALALVARRRRARAGEPTAVSHVGALRSAHVSPAAPAPDEVVLSVGAVSKSFGGNRALDDVSFEMRAGRIVGLVGANGSGKTTLINVISGFVTPDGGDVVIGSTPAHGLAPHQVSRAGLSRTFQVPRLIDDLTVRRNLEVGLLSTCADGLARSIALGGAGGASRAQRHRTAEAIVEMLRLDSNVLDVPAGELSLGLKRIVEIGRAIASGARVICLDEPAAGLNEPEIDRLESTLREIVGSGHAVLLVEHHMRFVLRICDDVLLLERGRVGGWWPDVRVGELPEALRQHVGVLL